jgi:hypothetical protein
LPGFVPSSVFARLFLPPARRVQAPGRARDDGHSRRVSGQAKSLEQGWAPAIVRNWTSISPVRELEQRLAVNEEWSKKPGPESRPQPKTSPTRPTCGRARLIDLIHLAIQTDSSRLITLMLGTVRAAGAGRVARHHDLSHHGPDPEDRAAKTSKPRR